MFLKKKKKKKNFFFFFLRDMFIKIPIKMALYYHIYPKYSDISSPYHTCSKNLNNSSLLSSDLWQTYRPESGKKGYPNYIFLIFLWKCVVGACLWGTSNDYPQHVFLDK